MLYSMMAGTSLNRACIRLCIICGVSLTALLLWNSGALVKDTVYSEHNARIVGDAKEMADVEDPLICLGETGSDADCFNVPHMNDLLETLKVRVRDEVNRELDEERQVRHMEQEHGEQTGSDDPVQMPMKFLMRTDDNRTQYLGGYAGRPKECDNVDYGDLETYPKSSVIITFCDNERLEDLLHTVHSIMQRTPPVLLKEVILIDDNTTKVEFKDIFANYLHGVFGGKVWIHRNAATLGLIQGRLLGARLAKGDVVVSMDAHMEVQQNWLEALVYEIKLNRKTLATSFLDWMMPPSSDGGSWEYRWGSSLFTTYFTFSLVFSFQIPREELKALTEADPTHSIVSPCTVGTIWAIEKQFFTEIGEFDEDMQLWGGENIDLPLRVWLFGGRAVNVPCSHAAHLERPKQREYRKGWDHMIQRNYKRVVEVWFDDYKRHFYAVKPELKDVDCGNISARLELKKKATYDFAWYLRNVYPELGIYDNDTFAWGAIRNVASDMCVDKASERKNEMHTCNKKYVSNQMFWLTTAGHWRQATKLYIPQSVKPGTSVKPVGAISTFGSPSNPRWIHWKNGPIKLHGSNLCLEAKDKQGDVTLEHCVTNRTEPKQQWVFETYSQDYEEFIKGDLHRNNPHFQEKYHDDFLKLYKERLPTKS